MEKEVYILLTRGKDGKFCISTYETLETAQKWLETYLEAQTDIEGVGGNVYIDRHEHEELSIPEFVLRPDSIVSRVTFNALVDGKVIKTDRYIIKRKMED